MKKKIALVMTSLLMLTALSTIPLAKAPDPPSPSPEGVYHWKIMLAQQGCNAWIIGWLTSGGFEIPGTDFFLNCTCELPEPQPLGQFVFWKVNTTVIPDDIHYDKFIDVDKDGTADIIETIDHPIPFGPLTPEEPHTWYEHVQEGTGPLGPWMVVVEVREQPYDEERPFFEWQLMIKQENCDAIWTGYLTDELNDPIPNTDFDIVCLGTTLQCVVVRTPYCTVPHDIDSLLTVYSVAGPWIQEDLIVEDISQFPWTWEKVGFDEFSGFNYRVELELTEVQMHRYIVMGGEMDSAGDLSDKATWAIGDWQQGAGTPFATRPPKLTPMQDGQNITFTQRDPITGIVKLGVPAESYVGLQHIWFGNDSQLWYNMTISMEEQGCGWLFTGIGKDPILGDVDLQTYNNFSGVYSQKPAFEDALLAGPVDITNPAFPSYGAGPPLGPCLQKLRGPDDVPGTADDPIGDGQTDPPGSALLFLPTRMTTYYWLVSPPQWIPLFSSAWPQLMTTGTASDIVNEPQSDIDGESATATGEPFEFFAGLDHPEYNVAWKHPKCNAYVTFVVAWSVLHTDTALGFLDVVFATTEKKVREDCVIADIDCNEKVDLYDIVKIGLAYGAKDEGWARPVADPNFDARADIKDDRGVIDLYDLVRCAIDYGAELTPACIIRP